MNRTAKPSYRESHLPPPFMHRIVAAYYDRLWGEEKDASWDSWSFFRQEPSATKHANDILGDVRGKEILEIACGTGRSSCSLARRGAEVCAVDLSEIALRKTSSLARLRLSMRRCQRLELGRVERFHAGTIVAV